MPAVLCIWSQAWGSVEPSQTKMVLFDIFGKTPETTYWERETIKMLLRLYLQKQSQMGKKVLLCANDHS